MRTQETKHTWFIRLATGIFIGLFSSTTLFSQVSVRANLDAAYFQNDQETYLEVYYSLADAVFKHIQSESQLPEAEVVFTLQISKDDSLWASKLWKIAKSVTDSTLGQSQNSSVDAIRYLVEKPGSYTIRLYTRAIGVDAMLDSAKVILEVPSIKAAEIQLSDVIFASKIGRENANSNTRFIKRGYEVVPNPAALYGESSPVVYSYFEAYHLDNAITGDKYKVMCKIEDNNGKEVKGTGQAFRTKRKSGETAIEMGTKIISKLPSGTYSFVYGIADIDDKIVAQNSKRIYIYNPSIPMAPKLDVTLADVGDKSFTELYKLTPEQLDDEFNKMVYLIDKPEKEFYKSLTATKAKADYIKEIWAKAGARKGTAGALYRYIYLQRVTEANEKFKSVFADGWKSDRGRVYILYGSPYEVQRYPSTPQTIPYEIWNFSNIAGQGGVIFIFSDRTGFKKYEQIHSTLIGELQEPDWRRLVSKGIQSDYTAPIDN